MFHDESPHMLILCHQAVMRRAYAGSASKQRYALVYLSGNQAHILESSCQVLPADA